MSKNPDKKEASGKIRQLGHRDGKISETLSKINSEELEILDLTSKPKLLQENHPQKEDTSENKSEKNKISLEEAEVCKNEFDCKKCGEGFKDFEGMAAHDCFYIRTNKSSLSIPKVFDQSQETVNLKLVAETSANENIAVSLTSKISSPSRKINEDDSPQSLSLTTFKHFPSPSIKTLKGDSSGRLTSSAVSHKFQSSRRSSPATKTRRSENEASKRVSTKYPVYATPPRSIRPSKELKNDSLNFKNSATKNLFEKHRRSSIATTERSPEIEVPSKIDTQYPAYVTPPRSIPSSHIHNDDSSRRLINPVAINLLQSPQMYSTEMISAFSGNVVIPAPINLNLSPRIYSTGTFTHSSRGIVIPPAINLEESPRIYNTETLTHSPGRVIIPAQVNILQSPEMYIIHRPSYSSGSVMSSTAVILQPCPIYSTETITDSSGSAAQRFQQS
ncbi:hypothetical protein TNCT_452501 [Trichonephila clavata]|uniref:Uncharacterized protein n=2 Tax=Trichonephila clavata TaxID=2740835 RepID=A0A8X6K4T4_TRICU|nr:hypothetical protein TNCT_452501 [Trichonephila clavata]